MYISRKIIKQLFAVFHLHYASIKFNCMPSCENTLCSYWFCCISFQLHTRTLFTVLANLYIDLIYVYVYMFIFIQLLVDCQVCPFCLFSLINMYCCMSLQLYCLLFVITCPFWNRCLSTICVAITSCLSRHCGWYLFRFVCPHIYILTYIYMGITVFTYTYILCSLCLFILIYAHF